ncbi:BlaI/MecI/CopY family transcriptional regulator [uncultured Faecalibaculum sp.]|uniref:BlaI/MecI/CopY family transcriptional regulator n=1 Tax=uncultured Faecalibaculum sp. TaxID=1729681 RepID=UPI00260F4BA7|nr:BlaI/MecI/CopY family transcriptional regulator [uncultured Faecalibaculum sp.]
MTKKESQIMDVFWSRGHPMIASEIAEQIEEMSIYSVQQVLTRLLKENMIQVSGIAHNRNAIARQYLPVMNEAEYLASIANSRTTCRQFTENFVECDATLQELNELQAKIETRIRELQEQKP